MSNLSFSQLNQLCIENYYRLGQLYHFYSPENHPIIFFCSDDYNAFTCQLGICAKKHPQIRILTYEIMSNHLHLIIAGIMAEIESFLNELVQLLSHYLKQKERGNALVGFMFQYREVMDIDYARNVIAYTNRNGYLADPDSTPITYPWGCNRFYFNQELADFHRESGKSLKVAQVRELSHSRQYDDVKGLFSVNNLVSPLSFCDVETGMSLFVNARHYFLRITRAVEAYSEIGKSIGESVFYTDDELYYIVRSIIKRDYSMSNPANLPVEAKMEIAKKMKYDYNSSIKQIQRMLKLEQSVAQSMFGTIV